MSYNTAKSILVILLSFSITACDNGSGNNYESNLRQLSYSCGDACADKVSGEEMSGSPLDIGITNAAITNSDRAKGFYTHLDGEVQILTHFLSESLVLVVSLKNESGSIDISGEIKEFAIPYIGWIFGGGSDAEAVENWVENQVMDHVENHAPKPTKTYPIPKEALSVLAVSYEEDIAGLSGEVYEKYSVDYYVNDFQITDEIYLPAFYADTAFYEMTADLPIISHSITINAVDEHGEPISFDSLHWYYVKNIYETWNSMECEEASCESWTIDVEHLGEIKIGGSYSLPSSDPYCFYGMEGKIVITIAPEEMQTVTLEITDWFGVCS